MAQINRFGGNISRTAAFIGMERSALHRKLKSLGVGSARADCTTPDAIDEVHGWPPRRPPAASPMSTAAICRMAEAAVHVEDRGLQFADGIYEVCGVLGGALLDEEAHLDRLERSLARARHGRCRWARAALKLVMREMIARATASTTGFSICRSPAARCGAIMPSRQRSPRPTLIMTCAARIDGGAWQARGEGRRRAIAAGRPLGPLRHQDDAAAAQCSGQAGRRARRAPSKPGWWMSDGYVTEGASTNAWIVDREGTRRHPRPQPTRFCPGVTRRVMLAGAWPRRRSRSWSARFTVAEADGPRGLPVRGHRRRPCRSWPSTASPSAMASPDRWRAASSELYARQSGHQKRARFLATLSLSQMQQSRYAAGGKGHVA